MAPRRPRDDAGSVPGRFGAGGCGGGKTPCKGWYHAIPGAAAAALRPESSSSLAKRAETWAKGGAPKDLPLVDGAKGAKATARDVFVYFIHEGKVRAPAAAMELIQRLED